MIQVPVWKDVESRCFQCKAHSVFQLLQLLRDNGGFLPLNDDSSPEEVTRLTGTSKKVFKRSLGMLLKRGAVEAGEKGIKIRKHGKD